MADEKWCKDCDSFLSLDLFYKDKSSPDGKDYYCKDCRKKRKLARADKEKLTTKPTGKKTDKNE